MGPATLWSRYGVAALIPLSRRIQAAEQNLVILCHRNHHNHSHIFESIRARPPTKWKVNGGTGFTSAGTPQKRTNPSLA